jgi:response regulator RpfG family c-di-GMP phosphodiesterase
MLYYLPNILVVSDRKDYLRDIERAFENFHDVHVYKAEEPEQVMEYLNKLQLVENRIPAVIFIDLDNPRLETEAFLRLLDTRYPFQTRDRVILINEYKQIGSIMKLLLSDSVHDIVNPPILRAELQTMVDRMSYNEGLLN